MLPDGGHAASSNPRTIGRARPPSIAASKIPRQRAPLSQPRGILRRGEGRQTKAPQGAGLSQPCGPQKRRRKRSPPRDNSIGGREAKRKFETHLGFACEAGKPATERQAPKLVVEPRKDREPDERDKAAQNRIRARGRLAGTLELPPFNRTQGYCD